MKGAHMSSAKKCSCRVLGALSIALGSLGIATLPVAADDSPSAGASASSAEGRKTIDIAAISDFHGHIENAAALAYEVGRMRTANPDTLFVGNGDLVGGSAYVSSIAADEPTIDILNTMGLQVSSTGNHEYDKGYSDVTGRLAKRASWPYLVANLEGIDAATVPPYHVITTKSGVRVGFVGTVTADLPTLVSPAGIAGLKPTDPVAATNKYASQLKDGDESNGEADVVVALMHEDRKIAASVGANVDAVVAGHTHVDANATTASGAPVIEPGSYGKLLGKISLSYDPATKKVASAKAENLSVGDRARDPNVPVDRQILAMYEKADANAKKLGAQQVGTLNGVAVRGTNNGTDFGANRGTESSLGNLLAESFHSYGQKLAKKPDFAVMNPGGLRADLDANGDGIVTVEESFSVQPFGNAYGTAELTSAQVYALLEQQWKTEGNASRSVQRLGLSKNLTYVYDPKAPIGSKVTAVSLDGKALDRKDSKTKHVVASNSFVLEGGDGYTVFKEPEVAKTYTDTGLIDKDVFDEYLKAHPGITPDYTQRSVGLTGPTKLLQGEKATFEISSLAFTGSEPKPNVAELRLGGNVVAQGTIDRAITPDSDETGKSTLTFTLPDDQDPGNYTLIVRTDDKTRVALPLTVVQKDVSTTPNGFVIKRDETVSSIPFGRPDDVALVGDWDGDGVATPAVKRGNRYFVANEWRGGDADLSFHYGKAGDVPIVGDWDGDGKDTVAVRRGSQIFVKNELVGGDADKSFHYGKADDKALAGDWDGDGKDTVAVRRGTSIFANNALTGGDAAYSYEIGQAGDAVVAGKWNEGQKADTVSFVRDGVLYVNAEPKGASGQLPTVKIGGTKASAYFAGVFAQGELDTVGYRG